MTRAMTHTLSMTHTLNGHAAHTLYGAHMYHIIYATHALCFTHCMPHSLYAALTLSALTVWHTSTAMQHTRTRSLKQLAMAATAKPRSIVREHIL